MNPADVYAVHVELISVLNGFFEIWIGFTFATIVAFHLGAPSINKFILAVGIFLYISASYVFVARYMHTRSVIIFLNDKFVAEGIDPYPVPDYYLLVAQTALFVVGVISTIGYSIYIYHDKRRDA